MTTPKRTPVNNRNLLIQLADQCIADSQRWFPEVCPKEGDSYSQTVAHTIHHTVAMFGEMGEFANIVKKIERGDKSLDDELTRFDLRDELTDVLIYMLNIAGILKIDLLAAYVHKRNRNEERFGPKARMQREQSA